jgi:hypothetical protein
VASAPGRGSTLTCSTMHFPTETHYHVGAFERAAELQPSKHVFANERLPWLHLNDASQHI